MEKEREGFLNFLRFCISKRFSTSKPIQQHVADHFQGCDCLPDCAETAFTYKVNTLVIDAEDFCDKYAYETVRPFEQTEDSFYFRDGSKDLVYTNYTGTGFDQV